MRTRASMIILLLVVSAIALLHAQPQESSVRDQPADLSALAALEPIDTHTHVAEGSSDFYAMLDRLHMHLVDILLVDDQEAYRRTMNTQRRDAEAVIAASDGHVVLCTSFDPFQFSDKDFPASAIRSMNEDFAKGAIAVKIWKNIGMELKGKNGHYILADDPKFEPIYQDIQKHNRTLIAHQAEPDEAWQPPDSHALDYDYYSENPFWYMYNKPDAPTKQRILEARDHLLAENPDLRVVGAHLGSLEDDLDGLAHRLDRYPNFAVDTAARVPHLAVMPSERVRSFILKYQDRIVYGTDLGFQQGASSADAIKEWQEQYTNDWRYFSTRDRFKYDGHETQGLGLPPEVLRKLYHDNAVHWFPGILDK